MNAPNLTIDDLRPWLSQRFDRSGGPGGQNVNKLSTRVTLLFDFENCECLSADQRQRLRAGLARRMSRDGQIRVVSQSDRSQSGNREIAEQRLLELIKKTLRARRPRRPTRPTAASRQRRLSAKRQRGATKRLRRDGAAADE